MLHRLLKKKPIVSGISILLLQREIDRFSTDTLNAAMQRAWRKPYDPHTFYATSLDGEGAVIKAVGAYFSLLHFDHRLTSSDLGGTELPQWALHNAHTRVEYGCPGGVPESELRHRMYGFLGLLCAELVSDKTRGLFFSEERILLRNTPALLKLLRSGQDVNPNVICGRMN
jgi:hypothetical protein